MIGEATTVESSPAGIDGDGFDVFSSLRSGAESDNFSSGAGEAGGADTDEAASSLDLVAVASGEAELNTVTNSKPESKETSAPVNPEQCQKYGTIACIGCGLRQFCEERQAAMMADNTELQPGEQLSTLEQLLREDDVPGEIVWARPLPDDFDGGELPIADSPRVIETSADKTDGSTEKITPQEQESKASTSEPVGTSGEDMDTEAAEAPFFGLKTTPETIADDTKDVGESRPESTSEFSNEGSFTEVAEVSSPPSEVKTHVIDTISDAVHNNKQLTPELLDTPAQAEAAPVPLAINKDAQTGDENRNPLKNETVYPMANEDKVTTSVVENTYDGDETVAPSSVKTPSIERQEENEFVITGSESANSEPSRVAEKDKDAIPVSEQQHLAAQFEAVKVDESATTGPIDNSGTKASTDAQPSEISIDAAPDYNNFVESTDGVDVEQPKHVIPTASNVSPYQEQEDAVNVSAEYETNETSTEKMVNAAASIPAKEQPDQPVIVSLSAQDIVEYGEDNEAWAEEDMVFFVEQQAPVVEPGVSSAEVVTIALPMEATTVREEVDDLKLSVDDEISVDMDSAGQLDNSKAVSVPEVTNDYEPVVEILEERIMPREERDNIVMKASEKSDLLCLDAEVETITMDTSGIESVVDLSEAQAELAAAEVSEAVESEVDEQNDLAVDSYGYNSEMSAVSDNVLVVKSRPSPGLWPDDSQLNPEEEFTTTTQSSADDSSLVSRLVGMFVVAMCVVRGRQSVKV
ncbi:hypothetical protein GWK74_04765 [Candidatus Saccharibacteria bacterium oral taxon 488]|nr:hypothetical protein GWK74_04765 [Candidatus Saccharibacteria bacterium oral taxon 488]